MSERVYFGNFDRGQQTDRVAFNIDNKSFPTLWNYYVWRGRVKRKRGTQLVGRLSYWVQFAGSPNQWQYPPQTITGGTTNLVVDAGLIQNTYTIASVTRTATPGNDSPVYITTTVNHNYTVGTVVGISGVNATGNAAAGINANGFIVTAIPNPNQFYINYFTSYNNFTYVSGGTVFTAAEYTIVPGSVNITVVFTTPAPATISYVDENSSGVSDGNLYVVGSGPPLVAGGTINYATGQVTFSGGSNGTMTGTYAYYPDLPVVGLRDFIPSPQQTTTNTGSLWPQLVAFDTENSYQINQNSATTFFYETNYTKLAQNPFTWDGYDWQQFYTTNYSGAMWATNNNPGFQFVNGTYSSGSGTTTIVFNFKSNGSNYAYLVVGDYLFFNEWTSGTINGVTGKVSNNSGAASGNYTVTFSANVTVSGTGIAQLLTNNTYLKLAETNYILQDGIRWYDGDPTSGTGFPVAGNLYGWVNFSPPLSSAPYSICGLPTKQYYLAGALGIVPFKGRLMFIGPWVQASDGTPPIQLSNAILWSWVGTPYYTVDASGNPILVPINQTASLSSWWEDIPSLTPTLGSGFGGALPAEFPNPIMTFNSNEDAIILGFGGDGRQVRFVSTGNDQQPFLYFNINTELPSNATFSSIAMDKGVIAIGQYGMTMTDQQSSQRIDLDIPDSIFQIRNVAYGAQRVNAVRDFFKEWLYFCYPVNNSSWDYPTQTFLYNYRDNTWSILYENFTAHGRYRPTESVSWATLTVGSWSAWREPWNSASSSSLFASIVAGNPQGFVLQKASEGTGEAPSGAIYSISNYNGYTQIQSFDHCVESIESNAGPPNVYDYIYVSGALGFLSSTITGVLLGNPTVITTSNSYSPGSYVVIYGINGTTQLNNNVYYILAATGTSITINVDSTDFTPYISSGTTSNFNGMIGVVTTVIDEDNFVVDIPFPIGTYGGLGVFTRLSQPTLLTKQFPVYWDDSRQVRLGPQKYLLETTQQSQVTVDIYLSQDAENPWNNPLDNPSPTSLIFSQLLYTCPESTNLGLTPANVNLQQLITTGQQIWHRMNTSLIGETFQVSITLSDAQMRNLLYATDEITLHGMIFQMDRGPLLA